MESQKYKEMKEKFVLGFLKYSAFAFNLVIVFGSLYAMTMYVLYIVESAH